MGEGVREVGGLERDEWWMVRGLERLGVRGRGWWMVRGLERGGGLTERW